MPKAYVVGQFGIRDPNAYEEYKEKAPRTIAEHGGRYLVLAGKLTVLEGEAPLPRVVVLEFPSFEQATAWYESEGYQSLVPIRQGAAIGRSFLVEGTD